MHPRPGMKKHVPLTIAILAALGLTAASAPSFTWAQNVKITTPEPRPEPRIITPGLLYEKRPSDDLYYLGIPPSVPYDPAFIEPFMLQVETQESTGRIGLSGWTAPNPPVGLARTRQGRDQWVAGLRRRVDVGRPAAQAPPRRPRRGARAVEAIARSASSAPARRARAGF